MSADVRACVYSIPVVASPQKVSIAVWNLASSLMIFPAFPLIDFVGWQKNFIQITSFHPEYPLLNPPLNLKPGIPGMPRCVSLKTEWLAYWLFYTVESTETDPFKTSTDWFVSLYLHEFVTLIELMM